MFERPEQQNEVSPSHISLDEINTLIKKEGTVEADFVFGLPEFKPESVIPSTHDWSYYSFDEQDPPIKRFLQDFLSSMSSSAKPEEIIDNATKYVVENIHWVRKEDTRSLSKLVANRSGSCTSKSVLLAYLLYKLGLESYVLAGYARNVHVDDCAELKTRNTAYKRGSGYLRNLFNLPLEPEDKPIEKDVGHAWVGIKTKEGVVYADPTTGLVSITPAERRIFSEHYKTLPIAHPDFIEGVEMKLEHQHSYLDLDFSGPVQKIRTNISNTIPEEWKGGSILILEGPENEEIKLVFPLKGFDVINRSSI